MGYSLILDGRQTALVVECMRAFKEAAPDMRRWALVRVDGRLLLANFPKRVAIERLAALTSVLHLLGNEMSRENQRGEGTEIWLKYRIYRKDEDLWLLIKPVNVLVLVVIAFHSLAKLSRPTAFLGDNLKRVSTYLDFILADTDTLPPFEFSL